MRLFSGVLCLCYDSTPSSEGTTSGGVVCFHRHDCLLGFPCINGKSPFIHIYHTVSGDVFGARYRKVPRDPLADDRVWILCALVFLLLHSRPGFCSEGEAHYLKLG